MLGRLSSYFYDHDGRARRRRMFRTILMLAILAAAGSVIFVVLELFVPRAPLGLVGLAILGIGLKLPLIAFLGWLIFRNKEVPGAPVHWSRPEVREILDYLTSQARACLDGPQTGPRLAYLAREAWHVADQADDEMKAYAVGVALEIERLATEHGVRRTA
jgi:hypothetical protein